MQREKIRKAAEMTYAQKSLKVESACAESAVEMIHCVFERVVFRNQVDESAALLVGIVLDKKSDRTDWLCTIVVAHTSSSTLGSPFRFISSKFRWAASTAPWYRPATVRQTSRTAPSRACSSLMAGAPARRSVWCARKRSASIASACCKDASSEVILA
jgi:hypothetical protein